MEFLKNTLVVLMVPLLGTVGLLLAAGGGDGVFENAGIARINHPRDLVFEWLTLPEHRTKWVPGLESCKTEDLHVEPGTTFREIVKGENGSRVERTVEVVTADYGELVVLRFTEPGRVVSVEYKLSVHQSARKTRIDLTTSGSLEGWWAKLTEAFASSDIQEAAEAELDILATKIRG